ncbi:MAG: hypothetical protein ABIH86_06735 [Planctomycetota bacterium]
MKNDNPAERSDRKRRDDRRDDRRNEDPRGSRRGGRRQRPDDSAAPKNTSLIIGLGVMVGLILIIVLVITSGKREPAPSPYGPEPKPTDTAITPAPMPAPMPNLTPSTPTVPVSPLPQPTTAEPQPPVNQPEKPAVEKPAPSAEPSAPAKADWAKLDSLDKTQDLLKWENATSSGCAEGFLRHWSRSKDVRLIVQPLDGNTIRIYRKLEKAGDQPPSHCNTVYIFAPLQGAQFSVSIGSGRGRRDQIINMDSVDPAKLPAHVSNTMPGSFEDIGGGVATLDVDLDKVIPGSGPFGIIRPFHVWIFFRSDTKSFLYDDRALQDGREPYIDPRLFFLTASNVATVEVK